jgi:hypothetical protein
MFAGEASTLILSRGRVGQGAGRTARDHGGKERGTTDGYAEMEHGAFQIVLATDRIEVMTDGIFFFKVKPEWTQC